MSTHGSGEPGIRLFVVAWVVIGAACGDEGGTSNGGACDPGTPEVPAASAAPVQGSMRIQDTVNLRVQDGQTIEERQSLISGGFRRIVETSTPAQFLPLGTQCVGFVSRPEEGESELLDGGDLTVVAAMGAETVSPDDANIYRSIAGGQSRLDGVSEVSVSGGGEAFEFPAFDAVVPAPDALSLSAPATDGSGVLPTSDLTFRWPAGNGELILISIAPQPAPESGGVVQCFFRDDGCGVVPASATTFLRSNNVENFVVVVSRLRDERIAPEDGVTMDVELASAVRFELPPGEGL
jgi:hypothetical protein